MCPVHNPGRSKSRSAERLRFATFRLNCFLWVENHNEGPHSGFGFAADISETGAGLYVGIRLNPGAQVRVAFESETSPTYRAVLMWCQRYSLEQHFMGHPALDHRVGLRLQFITEAERQRYLEYFKSLGERVKLLAPETGPKKL
jgi:PilZ domain